MVAVDALPVHKLDANQRIWVFAAFDKRSSQRFLQGNQVIAGKSRWRGDIQVRAEARDVEQHALIARAAEYFEYVSVVLECVEHVDLLEREHLAVDLGTDSKLDNFV